MNLDSAIIADDHPLFRTALKQALQARAPAAVLTEADSLPSLQTALAGADEVDLLLLDLHIPGAKGFSALAFVRSNYPDVPVVMVSANEDAGVIGQAQNHGAAGFIPKSASIEAIGDAVAQVLAGETCFPDWVQPQAAASTRQEELLARLASLTPQQQRVLQLVGEGLLNKQIAYDLDVSEATVKAHLTAIMRKLNVRNRTQAVAAINELTIAPSFGAE